MISLTSVMDHAGSKDLGSLGRAHFAQRSYMVFDIRAQALFAGTAPEQPKGIAGFPSACEVLGFAG
jgi:hypothetical protein